MNGKPAVTITSPRPPRATPSPSRRSCATTSRRSRSSSAATPSSPSSRTRRRHHHLDQQPGARRGCSAWSSRSIVIFLFLFSVRTTLVTAVSIPISVLLTFLGMLAASYSLNVITLAALTIAIGRVVDDSIVVIENIKRHIGLGEDKLAAIRTAVREVAVAVTASTDHHGRGVPAGRLRRRHHGRAVPAVRAHGDHRAAVVAVRRRSRSCRCSRTGSSAARPCTSTPRASRPRIPRRATSSRRRRGCSGCTCR